MEQGKQSRWCLSRIGTDSARVSVDQMPFTVGRDDTCHLQLDSERASRVHAQLSPSSVPDCLFLRDHGSTNGTYVNGVRFVEPVPVGHGDVLRFAEEDWTLEAVDVSAAASTVRDLKPITMAPELSGTGH